ncbi:uncharacterized protein LOC135928809 [Gordionus sp. m RMFG-2023]|uniref:uncharacterized protein LOC135928809 n=1 Tax=Gordionus sp. m RMFG-2023 TaxID=3053472 RepID=UPI0031FD9083
MKAMAFPLSDAQSVDLHPMKSKIKFKAKKTRLASLNIGTLKGKTRELASMLNKRKVDITCIQETKWISQKILMIGDGYKLYYNGIVSNRNGGGIILSQDLSSSVVEYILLKRVEKKYDFRAILDEAAMEILKDDLVIIGGDLNANVRKARDSYKRRIVVLIWRKK